VGEKHPLRPSRHTPNAGGALHGRSREKCGLALVFALGLLAGETAQLCRA